MEPENKVSVLVDLWRLMHAREDFICGCDKAIKTTSIAELIAESEEMFDKAPKGEHHCNN